MLRRISLLSFGILLTVSACGDDAGPTPSDSGTSADSGTVRTDGGPGPSDAGGVVDVGSALDTGTSPLPDAAVADAGMTPTGEPPELAGITEAHNVVRRGVGAPDLVWDPDLAVVAKTWADKCIDNTPPAGLIDHNDGRSDNYPGYVGENIYAHSGTARGPAAVQAWADEVADYDYASDTCAPNAVCGHYTQLVWAASLRLGCGLANCAGLRFPSTIVCNYSPGGNTGGRPY